MSTPPPGLRDLLPAYREALERFVARNAGSALLRWEPVEDLVQGILLHALEHEAGFEYRSGPELEAWLFRIARQQLYKRTAHWYALKRGSGDVVRLLDKETGALDPADTGTSPSSFAGRRERIVLATRALAQLSDRDREIVQRFASGETLEELAARLGIGYEAAKKARLRALERLKGLYGIAG